MWGMSREDGLFHHYDSSASGGTFACGRQKRVVLEYSVAVPDNACPECVTLFRTPAQASYVPQAQAAILEAPPQRYTGSEVPAALLERKHEEHYLRYVLQVAAEQAIAFSRKAHVKERGSIHSGEASAWLRTEARRKQEAVQSMQGSPYFARIDFAAENDNAADNENAIDSENAVDMIYIGRSMLETDADSLLIYDWRDPICTLYYRHNVGAAGYQAPGGEFSGDILLKRHLETQNGRLVSYQDAAGSPSETSAIEDGILLGMLRRNSSGEMRQIVQSIQAEQDEVIRVRGDVVVVQGPAGSGKTVVALHRAAYLLYEKRQEQQRLAQRFGRVSAQRMLVFSPNSIFSSYISRVLPDLNEEQITQTILENTIQAEVRKCLPKAGRGERWQVERREDYFEYILLQTEDALYHARIEGSAFKSSVAMLSAMETFLQEFDRQVEEVFEDMELSIYGQVIADPQQRIFYSKSDMQTRYRMARSASSVVDSIADVLQSLETRIVEFEKTSWISRSDEQGRNPLAITVKRLQQEKQRMENLLLPYQRYAPLDLYTTLLQNTPISIAESVRASTLSSEYTLAFARKHKVAYEDIVPLLLLSGHYRGFPQWSDIDHAVIDEAQDYSLLHYEYIKNCLPDDCTLTIVGDINQAISPLLNLHDYEGLETVFSKRITRLNLKRSYRSSVEITDFARHILKGAPPIDNVRRAGSKPKLLFAPNGKQAAAITALLKELAGKEVNSIAVLCKTRRDSAQLFRQLRLLLPADTPLTLLTDSATLAQGVLVVPVQLAKGLEFDAVILHDAGQSCYAREEERKLLYTACTRALHDLYLCCSGALSSLLPPADSPLYERHSA